ncbi:MAG: carbohydrate-binding family 9-like protein [Planctomycetota bacterium]
MILKLILTTMPRTPSLSTFAALSALLAASLLPSCASAPDHPVLDLAGDIPRHYAAEFTHSAPKIDGSLDDRAWRNVAWTANFVQVGGSSSGRPRYQSRAKMLWNRQYLFLGVWMIEPNLESIPVSSLGFEGLLTFVTRDAELGDYHMISLEPGGRMLDTQVVQGESKSEYLTGPASLGKVALSGTLDKPGDADRGWWVEIAIPWTSLEIEGKATIPTAGDSVRVNFSRQDWAWSPHYQHDIHDAELWGKVELKP